MRRWTPRAPGTVGPLQPEGNSAEGAATTRIVAAALVLGAMLGAVAFYAAARAPPNHALLAWLGARDRADGALAAVETWPICTAMGALAADTEWAPLDADFAAGKQAMMAGDWTAAIVALKLAALREPDNADIQNYIGYSHRRLRQLEPAFAHYNKAVTLNPRHRSAHEHLGEAYLAIGDLTKAHEHLLALQRICLIPCDEYVDLKKAIALYGNQAAR